MPAAADARRDVLPLALAGLLQPLPVLVALWLAAPDALAPASVALSFALGAVGFPLAFEAGWWLARRGAA